MNIYCHCFEAIPELGGIKGVEKYEHRALVQAKTGDLVITRIAPDQDYLDYNEKIGLGKPGVMVVNGNNLSLTSAMIKNVDKIISEIAKKSSINIVPFIGCAEMEIFANLIEQKLINSDVRYLAPQASISEIANDKGQFKQICHKLSIPVPMGKQFCSIDEACYYCQELFNYFDVLVVKIVNRASAMGNFLIKKDNFSKKIFNESLKEKKWHGEYFVIEGWYQVDGSHTIQANISPNKILMINEQLFKGEEKVFCGSTWPSLSSDLIKKKTKRYVDCLVEYFEQIGYIGNIHFDTIYSEEKVYFVEANARWGGCSFPRIILERIGLLRNVVYKAMDFHIQPTTFIEFSNKIKDLLWFPSKGNCGIIIYNATNLCIGKVNIIFFGENWQTIYELENQMNSKIQKNMCFA